MSGDRHGSQPSFVSFLGAKSAQYRPDDGMEKEAILGLIGKGVGLLGKGVGKLIGGGVNAAGRATAAAGHGAAAAGKATGRATAAAGKGFKNFMFGRSPSTASRVHRNAGGTPNFTNAAGRASNSATAGGHAASGGSRGGWSGSSFDSRARGGVGGGGAGGVGGGARAAGRTPRAPGNEGFIQKHPFMAAGLGGLAGTSLYDLATGDFKGKATLMAGDGRMGDYLKSPISGLLYQLGVLSPYTSANLHEAFDPDDVEFNMSDIKYDPSTGQYRLSPDASVSLPMPAWLQELRRRHEQRSSLINDILPSQGNEVERATGSVGRSGRDDRDEYDPFESTLGRRKPLLPIERGR